MEYLKWRIIKNNKVHNEGTCPVHFFLQVFPLEVGTDFDWLEVEYNGKIFKQQHTTRNYQYDNEFTECDYKNLGKIPLNDETINELLTDYLSTVPPHNKSV